MLEKSPAPPSPARTHGATITGKYNFHTYHTYQPAYYAIPHADKVAAHDSAPEEKTPRHGPLDLRAPLISLLIVCGFTLALAPAIILAIEDECAEVSIIPRQIFFHWHL